MAPFFRFSQWLLRHAGGEAQHSEGVDVAHILSVSGRTTAAARVQHGQPRPAGLQRGGHHQHVPQRQERTPTGMYAKILVNSNLDAGVLVARLLYLLNDIQLFSRWSMKKYVGYLCSSLKFWLIFIFQMEASTCNIIFFSIFSHPPKRMRVTYASGIRPAWASVSASASTLCTSYLKPLHGIISYCTCILV